jgi:hypothetical protein
MSVPIMLLKYAVAGEAGELLGRGVRGLYGAARGVARGAGDLGAGTARALGADEATGRALGYAGAAGAAYAGGKKAKQKADEWKYRHNFQHGIL